MLCSACRPWPAVETRGSETQALVLADPAQADVEAAPVPVVAVGVRLARPSHRAAAVRVGTRAAGAGVRTVVDAVAVGIVAAGHRGAARARLADGPRTALVLGRAGIARTRVGAVVDAVGVGGVTARATADDTRTRRARWGRWRPGTGGLGGRAPLARAAV